jgi:hypothetical protein
MAVSTFDSNGRQPNATESLSFMHFILIVCPCSLQTLGDLVTCDRKLMGACPNASRHSLKKPLPVKRKSFATDINMNLRNFGIVSNLQPRGIFVQTECSTCKTDYSCVHNSRFDCKRHTETKVPKDFDKLKTNKKSMSEFCGNPVKKV